MLEPIRYDVARARHSRYAGLKHLEDLKTRGLLNLETQAVRLVVIAQHQHPIAGEDTMAFKHQLIECFLRIDVPRASSV
ncbi:hypothetical protein [Achromobacter xylosoxidans]|uniref:hypothetical protein n=1 Tax=Alcaligenes xylosoxydans xylosoxydans TaxID=85698 RepID=UPI0015C65772|nr:hypothetical protein [Achromobacter xylosoxidans]